MSKQYPQFRVLALALALMLSNTIATATTASKVTQAAKATMAKTPLGKMSMPKLNILDKPDTPEIREKWAVIISVNEFQDPALNSDKSSLADTQNFAATIKDPLAGKFANDHVLKLSNPTATKDGIEDALLNSWLTKKALPGDLVVLYFAGLVKPEGNNLYYIASDSLMSEPESSAVELTKLFQTIKQRLQSKNILCILDTTTYIDATKDNTNSTEANHNVLTVEGLSKTSGVSILSRSALNTPVKNGAPQESSFSHYLNEGLKSQQGSFTISQLHQFVLDNLVKQSQTNHQVSLPVLVLAADAAQLPKVSMGMITKSSLPKKTVAIGHPVDSLQLNRPDLNETRSKQGGAQANAEEEDDDDDNDAPKEKVDFSSYLAKMKKTIQGKWQPPKGLENRRVRVMYTILRNGQITNASVIETSGDEAVDQTALEALKAASPLDPLPLGAPKSVQLRYLFDWKVSRTNSTNQPASPN